MTIGDFAIDHEGLNGRWRAYWMRPGGHGVEQTFDTEEQAIAWAKFMNACEQSTLELAADQFMDFSGEPTITSLGRKELETQ